MELENIIGDLIRKYRKQAGLSQEKLAFDSNLDRTYISFLERGHRQPTIHTLFKLCNALGVKPSDFIQEVEKAVENTTE